MKLMSMSLVLALIVSSGTNAGSDAKAKSATTQINGKVVPLAIALQKQAVKVDSDVKALALVTDDGKVYSLLKDDGARMFYLDKRLLDRPMRLTGKVLPGTQILQVTHVHSMKQGKLHEVYYWCENCQLRFNEPGICICCGAVLELIEEAVR
jgi:hypothetical protein